MGNKSKQRRGTEKLGKKWSAVRDAVAANQPRACNGSMWHGIAPRGEGRITRVLHRSGSGKTGNTLIGHDAMQRCNARLVSVNHADH